MNKRFLNLLQLNIALMDMIFINAIFFLCNFLFRYHAIYTHENEYMYFGFFMSAAWIMASLTIHLYNTPSYFSFEKFTKRSLQVYIFWVLIILSTLFLLRITVISRAYIITILTVFLSILIVSRIVYYELFQHLKKKNRLSSKIMIIGYNDLSKKLTNYLEESASHKQIIGFCEEDENVNELSRYPIMGRINNAIELCKSNNITEIYSTIAPNQNLAISRIMEKADQNCIRFRLVPDIRYFINKQVFIDYLKEIPVLNLRNEPLDDLNNRIQKRLFDITVSLFVIVFILSWLVPIIGLIIKLQSKGPIFFSQERSGKNNKPFKCLKFRSMRVNENAHLQQAQRNDSRITKIGKFLRRTSLDEFPQFINVFLGHMSIVGPRPHMLKHTDEYAQKINEYMIRHFMKPGITGWAQVNGYRGETNRLYLMQKRVEFDLWYQENWSLLLDIRIMFLTVFNTLKGEENAF